MRKSLRWMVGLVACLCVPVAQAGVQVFACEPEWQALVEAIGGEQVTAYSATSALQDPHQIQARPSLIAKARQADLVLCSGAELEAGWLPQVLRQAANSKVQPGSRGYMEAAQQVQRLELPTRLDRADGDVHASGNPHVQYDPRNILRISEALAIRLAEIDGTHAAHYAARQADFAARWTAALQGWETRGARLRGMKIIAHHKNAAYLSHWLGLDEVATLEPKPGIPPTFSHLSELLTLLKTTPVSAIIRMPYEDAKPSQWLSTRTQVPAVVLPGTVGGTPAAKDLFALFESTLDALLQARP